MQLDAILEVAIGLVMAWLILIGWKPETTPADQGQWSLKLFGFFLTGLAAAQGSPFWFDILRRLAGLRSEPAQAAKSE